MDIELARIVVVAITAAGVVVWLAALRFLVASWRLRHARPVRPDDEVDTAEDQVEGWLAGAVEVEGEARVLSARAARLLAQGTLNNLGPILVLDKADDRVRFERPGAGMANMPAHQWFRRGELRFTPLGSGQSRVSWLIEPAASAWLLWLGGAFQAVGLIALVAGGWAVYTYLASAAEPALRWQTFQMFQVCHFLWPPFLCGALYRAGTRSLTVMFDTLAQNLPYCEDNK
jgi:hypothetical protein